MVSGSYFWDGLKEKQKKWLEEAVKISVDYQRKLWAESESYSLNELKKSGVEIVYPDKSEFEKMVKPVYDYYKTNNEMHNLINQIKNQ